MLLGKNAAEPPVKRCIFLGDVHLCFHWITPALPLVFFTAQRNSHGGRFETSTFKSHIHICSLLILSWGKPLEANMFVFESPTRSVNGLRRCCSATTDNGTHGFTHVTGPCVYVYVYMRLYICRRQWLQSGQIWHVAETMSPDRETAGDLLFVCALQRLPDCVTCGLMKRLIMWTKRKRSPACVWMCLCETPQQTHFGWMLSVASQAERYKAWQTR